MPKAVTQGRAASPAAASPILELLPEPVLLARPEEDEGPEIAYANAAARELYRIDLIGAPLGAALRRPEVLEAIDQGLGTGEPKVVAFESIGVQPRFWRAFAQPLEQAEGGVKELVILLRDETDARRT